MVFSSCSNLFISFRKIYLLIKLEHATDKHWSSALVKKKISSTFLVLNSFKLIYSKDKDMIEDNKQMLFNNFSSAYA